MQIVVAQPQDSTGVEPFSAALLTHIVDSAYDQIVWAPDTQPPTPPGFPTALNLALAATSPVVLVTEPAPASSKGHREPTVYLVSAYTSSRTHSPLQVGTAAQLETQLRSAAAGTTSFALVYQPTVEMCTTVDGCRVNAEAITRRDLAVFKACRAVGIQLLVILAEGADRKLSVLQHARTVAAIWQVFFPRQVRLTGSYRCDDTSHAQVSNN